MILSEYVLALYITLAVVGGFALGLWVERLFVWYPFGLKPLTGRESMLGKIAVVTLVKPTYMEVKFDSQIWKAKFIGGSPPDIGETVQIREVISNTLVVAVPEQKSTSSQ